MTPLQQLNDDRWLLINARYTICVVSARHQELASELDDVADRLLRAIHAIDTLSQVEEDKI